MCQDKIPRDTTRPEPQPGRGGHNNGEVGEEDSKPQRPHQDFPVFSTPVNPTQFRGRNTGALPATNTVWKHARGRQDGVREDALNLHSHPRGPARQRGRPTCRQLGRGTAVPVWVRARHSHRAASRSPARRVSPPRDQDAAERWVRRRSCSENAALTQQIQAAGCGRGGGSSTRMWTRGEDVRKTIQLTLNPSKKRSYIFNKSDVLESTVCPEIK